MLHRLFTSVVIILNNYININIYQKTNLKIIIYFLNEN